MVYLTDLWLPILLSAVGVFVVSMLTHMVLKLHKNDYEPLPDESALLEAMRNAGVTPGNYHFPHCSDMKEMGSPEMMSKLKQGPIGFMNVMPSGNPAMGKFLGQWFVFSVIVGVMVAYVTGRTLGPGADYLAVFRIAGVVSFLTFSGAEGANCIWKGQNVGTTLRHLFDGLLYGLVTGGVFGWLWP